jgi:UDP-N-acetylmuramate: L-alanyl-gamma-D-glutamyl-meso-diaminopimelate ligase
MVDEKSMKKNSNPQSLSLKAGAHIHLMGICGTAMASLAGLLQDRGFKITGSDSNPYPPMSTQLESLKIAVMKGYRKENLNPQPDFVIVGNVISASNEEAQELVRLNIPFTSLAKAMGEFIIENRQSIVISGTHGKTTTSSLMAWVAEKCEVRPGYMIGGIPKNFSKSFANPEGDFFVIEGDEYDTAYFDKVPKFIHYRPRHVILTSVEFDHADIYADLDAVKAAFTRLLKLIPQNGTLLWCAEDRNIPQLESQAQVEKKFSYGLNKGDYRANVKFVNESSTGFEVYFKNEKLGDFKIGLSGDYNVLNALSVIGLSHQLKWPMDKVKQAMESFAGVKRRQEVLGEPNGVLIIEDFAHHPTAVKETILGIKKKYPQRKVFAVFEPRSATSRRKIFQKEYVEAFKVSDEILLAQAFDQTKIQEVDRFSSEELVSDLKKGQKSAQVFSGADEIVQELKKRTQKGDLVLIMSNGGFDGIYGKLLKALGER